MCCFEADKYERIVSNSLSIDLPIFRYAFIKIMVLANLARGQIIANINWHDGMHPKKKKTWIHLKIQFKNSFKAVDKHHPKRKSWIIY